MKKPRYHCNACSFGTDVRVVMKDHAAMLGHFGWTDSEAKVEPDNFDLNAPDSPYGSIPWAAKVRAREEAQDAQAFPETATSYTMEVSLRDVDPDLLGILTGGVIGGNPPEPTFSIHVTYPVTYPARRRTFWEWLRRKPKHHAGAVYLPNRFQKP